MLGYRTLRTRLFIWFLGAILLATLSSALVVGFARPDITTGGEVVAKTVGNHLGEVWEDLHATEAYVQEVREVTGFNVKLFRDVHHLPPNVRAVAHRGGVIAGGPDNKAFVPILRGDKLVGALQMERFSRPRLTEWWRLAAGIVAALVVLAFAAGRVSNLLAQPLEKLGTAVDRFGAGDFTFRTDLAEAPKRWIAKEVHDVALAFNKMADRVEGMVRGQRELLAAISHELRSPLGRARIAVEIARDRVNDEDEAAPKSTRRSPAPQLDEIEKQLQEVDAILGDLLAVTRASLADLRKESLPIAAWLRSRVAEEPSVPAIELTVTLPDDARVAADPALLGRVVHNLLANARAHGHPIDQPLCLFLEPHASGIAIRVRDRGPGFSPELLPRAFEPFVRGDASRSRPGPGPGGSGLGLALVRRIAEAHGGEAFARNVEGGAEVGLTLPKA